MSPFTMAVYIIQTNFSADVNHLSSRELDTTWESHPLPMLSKNYGEFHPCVRKKQIDHWSPKDKYSSQHDSSRGTLAAEAVWSHSEEGLIWWRWRAHSLHKTSLQTLPAKKHLEMYARESKGKEWDLEILSCMNFPAPSTLHSHATNIWSWSAGTDLVFIPIRAF